MFIATNYQSGYQAGLINGKSRTSSFIFLVLSDDEQLFLTESESVQESPINRASLSLDLDPLDFLLRSHIEILYFRGIDNWRSVSGEELIQIEKNFF